MTQIEWSRNEVRLAFPAVDERRWVIRSRVLVFAEIRVWGVYGYGWYMGSHSSWQAAMDYITEFEATA